MTGVLSKLNVRNRTEAALMALGYIFAKRFIGATAQLSARAQALGHGQKVEPLHSSIAEFATIADAMVDAERAIATRRTELEAVLDTVPAAVWFTYDPKALQVIRNRFAAELMGLPTEASKSFGQPEHVIDTVAVKDGHELTTNAIKYGSLSNPTGRVCIRWSLVSHKQHRCLDLDWRETGGPRVGPGGRKGFGTQLLERVFDSDKSGSVALKFEESGLICEFRVILSH